MTEVAAEDLVFVDEAGVNLAMSRQYGWAPCGERLVAAVPFQRGKNISVIGALGYDGLLATLPVDGSVNRDIFRRFLREHLIPELLPGQTVVMDNLRVHHDSEVRAAIEAAGCHLLYLPPYHPQLDPIEHAWSKFKEKLRAIAARTRELLEKAIQDSLQSISGQDAKGWFAHCGYVEPCNKVA